ncbi:DMT family transporter [Actinomycetospora straminea]|uniref:DMT family transporter n=1 Tax=Actinomycetospora straminea TaxID=663607 RepID=UPI0023657DED|nr:DMT family transporter [Actinomycetospora straminea]MDD7932498.1 DMT family transporter [Actinomycetospora straminea]
MTRSLARADADATGDPTGDPVPVPRVDARLVAVAGSLCIAFSPIFIALAGTSPGTATFFRCALALPLLAPLALLEWRRRRRTAASTGNRPFVLLLGGVLLGLDMTLWAESVRAVGAGVSTVVVNAQVVILPLLAFLVLGERVRRTFVLAVPVMLVGVALAGGLVGGSEAMVGSAPVRGTVTALVAAVAYAGYLLFVRLGAGPGQRFTPVAIATVGAGATSFVIGSFWQGVDLAPGWPAIGWLVALAVVGQVTGWVLIASALPRLPSSTGASILLLQPVGAVLLGAVILGERPGVLQLLGCAVVLGAVAVAARTRAAPPPEPAGEPAVEARGEAAEDAERG